MKINNKLKEYIEKNIFPIYKKNDLGHGIDHIEYVINRSLKFASTLEDINYDMVYTIAAYHDIAHHIDAKHHEELGAKKLLEDENLKEYFDDEQIRIMSEAVCDHRASLEGEPRSIYGKIVSSADRNVLVEGPLKRTYYWRLEHCTNAPLDETIETSREHCLQKFGSKGYATEKMYFEDLDYKKFLEDITSLAENKEEFLKRYVELNILEKPARILYTNWEGKTGYRNIIPKSIEYKSTDWHKEEQWILNSYDLDKQADRGFALKDIKEWILDDNIEDKYKMKIRRQFDDYTKRYKYEFEQNGNKFYISFMGNQDLYFVYYKNNSDNFVINKENSYIYDLFDKLYSEISECHVFNIDPIKIDRCETYGQLQELEEEIYHRNERLRYKQRNLFKDNKIVWISDNSNEDTGYNIVSIGKQNDKYILNFDFNEGRDRTIRISNSGSRYDPFNICFIRLFHKLQEYDPEYHQMTIDEYNTRKTYKLTNNQKE